MNRTSAACVVDTGEEAVADELPAADGEPDDEPVVDAYDEGPDDEGPNDEGPDIVDDVPFIELAACCRLLRLNARLYVVGTWLLLTCNQGTW